MKIYLLANDPSYAIKDIQNCAKDMNFKSLASLGRNVGLHMNQ